MPPEAVQQQVGSFSVHLLQHDSISCLDDLLVVSITWALSILSNHTQLSQTHGWCVRDPTNPHGCSPMSSTIALSSQRRSWTSCSCTAFDPRPTSGHGLALISDVAVCRCGQGTAAGQGYPSSAAGTCCAAALHVGLLLLPSPVGHLHRQPNLLAAQNYVDAVSFNLGFDDMQQLYMWTFCCCHDWWDICTGTQGHMIRRCKIQLCLGFVPVLAQGTHLHAGCPFVMSLPFCVELCAAVVPTHHFIIYIYSPWGQHGPTDYKHGNHCDCACWQLHWACKHVVVLHRKTRGNSDSTTPGASESKGADPAVNVSP